MPIAIGLRTKTHVFIAGETVFGESIIKVKETENRTTRLGPVLVNISGKQADELTLRSYATEVSLYRAGYYRTPITPELVADTIRCEVHSAVRKAPLQCSSIVAGPADGALGLYSIDAYGMMHSDNFVVTGYGLYFLFGLFDNYYSEDMSESSARVFIELCIKAIKEQLMLETNCWTLDSVSVDGEMKSEDIKV